MNIHFDEGEHLAGLFDRYQDACEQLELWREKVDECESDLKTALRLRQIRRQRQSDNLEMSVVAE